MWTTMLLITCAFLEHKQFPQSRIQLQITLEFKFLIFLCLFIILMLLSLFSLVLQQNKNVVIIQAFTMITHFSCSSKSVLAQNECFRPFNRDEVLMVPNLRNTQDSLSIFIDHTVHTLNNSNAASQTSVPCHRWRTEWHGLIAQFPNF
jgi:hypothetical protein